MTDKKLKTGILGASGYTGAELCRFLVNHPRIDLTVLTADRKAGMAVGDVFPHLRYLNLPDLVAVGDVDWLALDVVFCALPHATTQEIVKTLPDDLLVIDLSADFRLSDVATYEAWYGTHHAPELQPSAVYGLAEINHDVIKDARLIAVPGCYPTSAQLPLIPLLKDGLVNSDDIIIDAKSGVSGAGRGAKEAFLFSEVAEGFKAYGVGAHRHRPEIEQGLSLAAGKKVEIAFTPHLVPMIRGILSTIYVKLESGKTVADLRDSLKAAYQGRYFVEVLEEGVFPDTAQVRGSNRIQIAVAEEGRSGRAILLAAEDNLVKGASGQAIQCLNIRMGWPEETGLEFVPAYP